MIVTSKNKFLRFREIRITNKRFLKKYMKIDTIFLLIDKYLIYKMLLGW